MDSGEAATLRVAEQYVSDSARGRCRLHREVMNRLGLSPGEPVEIECHEGSIAVFAYPANESPSTSDDANPGEVYVDFDWFLDSNEDDFTGREVRVRPASPAPADRVAYERLPSGIAPEVRSMVTKENPLGTLTLAGTRLSAYRKEGSDTSAIAVPVVETDPDGIVVVTAETELEPRPPTQRD
ncbi:MULTISPECIES: hypothetical protein [Halorussus]|uniref:hypothetical protein n=1 Tax=Halorussus TaxID=1070314 RepID=UPI0020A0A2DF|nr:hypothetical protein [Halorussus vallis]USZ76417.1 hypothetical protein NGM07_03595 [Halorussus vallis]